MTHFFHIAKDKNLLLEIANDSTTDIKNFETIIFHRVSYERRRFMLGLSKTPYPTQQDIEGKSDQDESSSYDPNFYYQLQQEIINLGYFDDYLISAENMSIYKLLLPIFFRKTST